MLDTDVSYRKFSRTVSIKRSANSKDLKIHSLESYGQDCQGPYQVPVSSRRTMKQLEVVKKQLIPVEQSREVYIQQLLRTSNQEVIFSCQGLLCLNTWNSIGRPSLRFGAIFSLFWRYSFEMCLPTVWQYPISYNILQSWQIRRVEPLLLMSFDVVIAFTFFAGPLTSLVITLWESQNPKTNLAECRQPKLWQVVHLLVLFVWSI